MFDFIIGGFAGMISRTLTAPLELLKIQEQNRFVPNSTFRDVIKNEGVKGLWKGNYSNCIRIFPQMAINYSCFTFTKSYLEQYINNNQTLNLFSGAVSGAVAMSIVYPMETIRSRLSLQTNKSHYTGIMDVFHKTPKRQLYNGLKMSLMGFAPYNALNFMFYNYFSNILIHNSSINDNALLRLIAGGLSGMLAVSITYPTDLIRRRLQLQGFDPSVPKYNGIVDCIRKIILNEGYKGLYRGLTPCYIKIFPANAIQFLVIFYGNKMYYGL